MESRQIDQIFHALTMTTNQSLFGRVSTVTLLPEPPQPLTVTEMHKVSGEIITGATREVLMAFYKFSGKSEGGKIIIAALEELKSKAEREKIKIRVCMIVNSRGKFAQTVYKANSPFGVEGITNSEWFSFTFITHPTFAFGALHSKFIIVDGCTAMVRGGDPHGDNDSTRAQFETASLIRGPIVSYIRYDFADLWKQYNNETLELLAPPLQSSVSSSEQAFIPCLFVSKRENGNLFSYTDSLPPYKIAFLYALDHAKESIHIMTSNINDPDICMAIAKACNRGVKVFIMTGKHHNDHTEYYWGGTNHYALASIVKSVDIKCLDNLHFRWNVNPHAHIVKNSENFTIHAKYAAVDIESTGLTFCGSSPLDVQAMKYSREGDLIIQDKKTAKQYNDKFFVEKFSLGKDYFIDAFETLLITIELHTKRIEEKIESDDQSRKAKGMRAALTQIQQQDSRPALAKIFALLESIHPFLLIKTGYKPGSPESYNAVMDVVCRYGLETHLETVLKQKLPEWKTPEQMKSSEKSTVSTSQFGVLSSPLKMKLSSSCPDLTALTHPKDGKAENEFDDSFEDSNEDRLSLRKSQ